MSNKKRTGYDQTTNLPMTTIASRYCAMSEGDPELALSLKDLDKSTHLFIFGQTSFGMTSAANYRSSKRLNKQTRNKPRR